VITVVAVTSKLTWYVARAGGLVAWATCSASIVWGLLLSTRVVRGRGVPGWLLDLHRFLGALTIMFTAVHMLGLYLDHFAPFGTEKLFVPMASTYRPGAVAWGIVGFYLLIAIEVTSLFMRRIPKRWWRAVHMTSFCLFVAATVHAFEAGADARNMLIDWLALLGAAAVVFLVVIRVLSPRRSLRTVPATREQIRPA
jgi:predicted ferric reductase